MRLYPVFFNMIQKEFNFNGPVPLIHLLNTTTRMLFEILFVMLIGAIDFPFTLGIQCLHGNEKNRKVFW